MHVALTIAVLSGPCQFYDGGDHIDYQTLIRLLLREALSSCVYFIFRYLNVFYQAYATFNDLF